MVRSRQSMAQFNSLILGILIVADIESISKVMWLEHSMT